MICGLFYNPTTTLISKQILNRLEDDLLYSITISNTLEEQIFHQCIFFPVQQRAHSLTQVNLPWPNTSPLTHEKLWNKNSCVKPPANCVSSSRSQARVAPSSHPATIEHRSLAHHGAVLRCGLTTGCDLGQVSWELRCCFRPDRAESVVEPQPPSSPLGERVCH